MAEHKDFDGCAITARHLGLDGHAWVVHAWGDQYYCMVKGTWGNGNAAEGCYCRATADEIRPYIIRGENGGPMRSPHAD